MLNLHTTDPGATVFPAAQAGRPWPLAAGTEWRLAAGFVAFQVAILGAMILLDGLPYILGERIKLQVMPVDPRDLFRGDYVVLDYDFNRMSPDRLQGRSTTTGMGESDLDLAGRDVYVALKPQGNHFVTESMSIQRPIREPYLRGKFVNPYRVECGIEAYYVQEGEGRRLENLIRQRRLLAEVAVWHGQAKLVRLIE